MNSVNKAIVLGNLGQDPETRVLPNGNTVTNLRIATSHSRLGQDNERVEETEWHSIVCFSKRAEIAAEHLKKGMQVYIEGPSTRALGTTSIRERRSTGRRSSQTTSSSSPPPRRPKPQTPPPATSRAGNARLHHSRLHPPCGLCNLRRDHPPQRASSVQA